MVERTLIRPPSSHLGPIDVASRASLMAQSPMAEKYNTRLDRQSAYEILTAKSENAAIEAADAERKSDADDSPAERYTGKGVSRSTSKPRKADSEGWGDAIASVVIKELKGTTGRRIVRGILGGLFKGR